MARKKKRRDAQQKKQQPQETAPAEPAAEETAAHEPEQDSGHSGRRAQQIREWEKRKRQRERGKRSTAPYFWGAGVAAVIAAIAVGGFLLLSAGDGETSAAPSTTPDARVAGLPIDVSLTVQADDDGQNVNPRYVPPQITAEAGQVIEIVMDNVGSVVHNLRLAGIDEEYATGDDWVTDPLGVEAGSQGKVVVKIDEPGTYQFKCDFHPTQVGTLILA